MRDLRFRARHLAVALAGVLAAGCAPDVGSQTVAIRSRPPMAADVAAAIGSVEQDRMVRMMEELASRPDLVGKGRAAGDNSETEEYLYQAFGAMNGMVAKKRPFSFTYTRTDGASLHLVAGDGTPIQPFLPKLKLNADGVVDWNDPVSFPYVQPTFDYANWENREPVLGIDYTVSTRSGHLDPGTYEVANTYDANVDPKKTRNRVVVDPTVHFTDVKHAFDKGAKAYLAPWSHTGWLAEFLPGWLSEERYGEVMDNFAQIGIAYPLLWAFFANWGNCSVELSVQATHELMTIHNVIGEIPGNLESPTRDEVVIVSAHFDGQGTQPGAPETTGVNADGTSPRLVYPSTNDNASGVAILMEVARVMSEAYEAGWRPARTLRFIAFNAEELWRVGADAYLDSLSARERANIVAAVNMDIMVDLDVHWTAAVVSDVQKHPYIWDALQQGLIDAQLDSSLCLLDHINVTSLTAPAHSGVCADADFVFVAPVRVGPSEFDEGRSDMAGWWTDFHAFKERGLPAINLGVSTPPWVVSPTIFQRHNAYDNVTNVRALNGNRSLYHVARAISALVLELGSIPTPLVLPP